jgi:zinc protease
VKEKQVAISVDGGLNWPLGNPLEYKGPTLMTSFIVAPPNTKEDDILRAYDTAISDLTSKGPSAAELARISSKMRSDWYAQLEIPISRASILSHAVLFDGNADRVSALPSEIGTVTSAEIRAFAAKYLVNSNRTVIYRVPSAEGGEK